MMKRFLLFGFLASIFSHCSFPSLERSLLENLGFTRFLLSTTTRYFLGGTISGLDSGKKVVIVNAGEELTLSQNGNFLFRSTYKKDDPFEVSVKEQPLGQTCRVEGAKGSFLSDVTTVTVICGTSLYTVTGTVTGLAGSNLQVTASYSNGETETRPISSLGSYSLSKPQSAGITYTLSVFSQPVSPTQVCSITPTSGTFPQNASPIANINCVTNTYIMRVSVTGLSGGGLVVINQNSETIPIGSDGSYDFPTQVASGSSYSLSVQTQPSTGTCAPFLSTGTVGGTILNLPITCNNTQFLLGGTITGLTSSGLILKDQISGDTVTIASGATNFNFPNTITSGSSYNVTVDTQPSGGIICNISSGSGSGVSGHINSISVNCAPQSPTPIVGVATGPANVMTITAPATNTICYTTNGSVPTCDSSPSAGACGGGTTNGSAAGSLSLVLNATTNVRAVTCKSGHFPSIEAATASTFTGTVNTVGFSPAGAGPFNNDVTVTLTSANASHIYYTTDNTTPSCQADGSEVLYSGGLTVTQNSATPIRAIGCGNLLTSSTPSSDTYSSLQVASVSMTPAASSLYAGDSIAFSSTTTSAWFCSSTATTPVCGGSVNTCSTGNPGTSYSYPGGNISLRAVGCKIGYTSSAQTTQNYTPQTYNIGGTITGLPASFGLGSFVLELNGSINLTIAAGSASFTFGTGVASGATYDVQILTFPQNPWYDCSISNGNGTVATANISNVSVSCSPRKFNLVSTGNVSGMNSGETISISLAYGGNPSSPYTIGYDGTPNTSLPFNLDSGTNYQIEITGHPPGKICSIAGISYGDDSPGQSGYPPYNTNVPVSFVCHSGQIVNGTQFFPGVLPPIRYNTNQGLVTLSAGSISGYGNGTGGAALFQNPNGITFDGTNLFVTDKGNHLIRRINPNTGAVTLLAGTLLAGIPTSGCSDASVGTGVGLYSPSGIVSDGTNLYVSESAGNRIRKIVISSGRSFTLAGGDGSSSCTPASTSGYVDNVNPKLAQFNSPSGLALVGSNLYIADTGNGKIRKLNLVTGEVSTFSASSFTAPVALASDGTYLYVGETNAVQQVHLGTSAVNPILSSTGGSIANGYGSNAKITGLGALFFDNENSVYITNSDGSNQSLNTLRRVSKSKNFWDTIAGGNTTENLGANGSYAGFQSVLQGIATDGRKIFLADNLNQKIKKVEEKGLVAYWPLNGHPTLPANSALNSTFNDYNSNNANQNNLTSTAGVLFDTGRNGAVNGSLSFDGTNPLTSATSTGLPTGTGPRSLCTWIKHNLPVNSGFRAIAIMGQASFSNQFGLGLERTAAGETLISIVGYSNDLIISQKLLPGNWYHLCGTFENTIAKLYLNGKIIGYTTKTWNLIASTIQIGAQVGNVQQFIGSLSDVRVYNRALNDSEINMLADSDGELGLVSHHKLTSTTVVPDYGPNNFIANTSGAGTRSLGWSRNGDANGSVRFEQSTSVLLTPGGGSMLLGIPNGNSPRTVCGWVHLSQIDTTFRYFMSYGNFAANELFGIGIGTVAGTTRIRVSTQGTNDDFAANIPINAWNHICVSHDGSQMTAYFNGAQAGTPVAKTLNTNSSHANSRIALGNFTSNEGLVGKLNELQIYNNALTSDQIAKLSAQIPEGLVAHYSLNGDTKEHTGFGDTLATVNGTVNFVSDRFGNTNRAAIFGGGSTLSGSSFNHLPHQTMDRSMCAWIRNASRPSFSVQTVFGYGGSDFFHFELTNTAGINFITNNSQGVNSNTTFRLPMYSWNHICEVSISNGTGVRHYLNGALMGSYAVTQGTTPTTGVFIGSKISGGYPNGFIGNVDDVLVYNRTLSPAEIQALAGVHPYQLGGAYTSGTGFASLKFFLDATVTATTHLTNVSYLEDASGSNQDMNAPASFEPIFESNAINGKPGLNFTNRYFENAVCIPAFNTNQGSYFGAMNHSVTGGGFKGIFHHGNRLLYMTGGPTNNFTAFQESPGLNAPAVASVNNYITLGSGLSDMIFALSHGGGGTGIVSKDGIDRTQSVTATGTAYACISSFTVGTTTYAQVSNSFAGKLGDLIFYNVGIDNTSPTTNYTDYEKVQCYLSAKYGLPVGGICE